MKRKHRANYYREFRAAKSFMYLVPPTKHTVKGRSMVSGEPSLLAMDRWPNDRALVTHQWSSCCNCRMQHFTTYQVFLPLAGNRPYMISRSYVNPDRKGKKVRR